MGDLDLFYVTWIIRFFLCFLPVVMSSFNETDFTNMVDVTMAFCGDISICDKNRTMDTSMDKDGNLVYGNYIQTLPVKPVVRSSCCSGCSCDINTCKQEGNCCPDILKSVSTPEESKQEKLAFCEHADLKNEYASPYVFYKLCPGDFNEESSLNSVIKHKCENYLEYTDLVNHVPVTDQMTNKTFKNKFCAECNHVVSGNIIYWEPSIECENTVSDSFLANLNEETVVGKVRNILQCNLFYKEPPSLRKSIKKCGNPYAIDTCNVTGLWKMHDPLIEAACHAFTSIYHLDYRNVFCYICNNNNFTYDCSPSLPRDVLGSFSALLNFNPDARANENSPSTNLCNDNEVFDIYKNVCRKITCLFPKIYENGKCVNLAETVSGLSYRLFIMFTPESPTKFEDLNQTMEEISDKSFDLLSEWGVENTVYASSILYKLAPESNTSESGNATTTTEAIFGSNTVVDYIVVMVDLYFFNSYTVVHKTASLDKILASNGILVNITDSLRNTTHTFKLTLEEFVIDEKNEVIDLEFNMTLNVFPVQVALAKLPYIDRDATVQTVTEKLDCPMVTIFSSEYNVTKNNLGVFIEELNVTFNRKSFIEEMTGKTQTDGFLICQNLYFKALEGQIGPDTEQELSGVTPQGILSLVCTCLSVICALCTLLTYSIFTELRTQPGINNMGLVICLIVAQLFFQFGINQTDAVPVWACRLIGVLIHFLWLSVLMWMNVCSFHMYQVFSSNVMNRNEKNLRRTFIYTLYSVCIPIIFIVINIGISSTRSDSEKIGYGEDVCYISDPIMLGFLFALPVGIVIMFNIALFTVVIFKVTRNIRVNDNIIKTERNYFKIYAKLSTLTGVTWLFGFLFFFTKQEFLEYVFIILNAGQGVFIFLSFVCNKRVFNLYKLKFFGKKSTRDTSTSRSKSMTRETSFGEVTSDYSHK